MATSEALLFLLLFFISPDFFIQEAEGKQTETTETTLQLVQVIFRHGNRTPELPYFDDPNSYESFHPYGWNALDKAGHQKAYNLGRFLKDLYGDLISQNNFRDVRILSTDNTPTKLSAQLVAAGLFPPTNDMKWGPPESLGDLWQPIPYQFLPLDKDNLIYMNKVPCPAYDAELTLIEEGPISTLFVENNRELVETVYRNAKPPSDRVIPEIARLYQSLAIADFNNLTIPEWAQRFYPDEFLNFSKMYFKTISWTRKMQRLRGGPLLGHIIRQMELKEEGSEVKMWLYSGHDYTVSYLGRALRILDDFFPDFGSAIIVELHSNSERRYFVKTFFHNDTAKQPMQLAVPGCQEFCPLDKFRHILSDSIPLNYTAECLKMSSSAVVVRPTTSVILFVIVAYIIREVFLSSQYKDASF